MYDKLIEQAREALGDDLSGSSTVTISFWVKSGRDPRPALRRALYAIGGKFVRKSIGSVVWWHWIPRQSTPKEPKLDLVVYSGVPPTCRLEYFDEEVPAQPARPAQTIQRVRVVCDDEEIT